MFELGSGDLVEQVRKVVGVEALDDVKHLVFDDDGRVDGRLLRFC